MSSMNSTFYLPVLSVYFVCSYVRHGPDVALRLDCGTVGDAQDDGHSGVMMVVIVVVIFVITIFSDVLCG